MKRKDPTNDVRRLDQLRTIAAHPDQTNQNGERLISETTLQKTSEIATALEAAIRNRNQSQTRRRIANRERDRQTEVLILLVRQAWRNLDAAIRLGQLEKGDYSRFGLDARGRRPDPRTSREWLLIMEQLIDQSNPDIPKVDRETLTSQHETTNQANLAAENAEVSLRKRQKDLERARHQADNHLKQTAQHLKAILYNEDATTKRRTMRALGYRFEGDGETETEAQNQTTT